MLNDGFNGFRKSPFQITIFGKNLFYKVNLLGNVYNNQDSLKFELSVEIRLGLLKSQGIALTNYQAVDGVYRLQNHSVEAPGIKHFEKYNIENSQILYSKKGTPTESVEVTSVAFLDPLPLVFQLVNSALMPDGERIGYVLMGGGVKNYILQKEKGHYKLYIESRLLFSGEIFENEISIEIPQYKVKLRASKKN